MKHELIKTENYLLVVDDSEIKEGDLILYKNSSIAKCLAHLPLNNSPILQGVDLLPPLEQEDDVEKVSEEEAFTLYHQLEDASWFTPLNIGFRKGYNKAKERYKYTEEDMRKAYLEGKSYVADTIPYFDNFEEFIQSLSLPKMPVAFECEVEHMGSQEDGDFEEPKKYTNSQGQTVLIGRYIY